VIIGRLPSHGMVPNLRTRLPCTHEDEELSLWRECRCRHVLPDSAVISVASLHGGRDGGAVLLQVGLLSRCIDRDSPSRSQHTSRHLVHWGWASSRRRGLQTGDRGCLNAMFTRVFDSLSTMSRAKGDAGMLHSALYAFLRTLSPAVGTVSNEVASQRGRADTVIRCAHP